MRPTLLLLFPFFLPSTGHAAVPAVSVSIDNPLPLARPAETVAVALRDLHTFSPTLDPQKTVVKNAKGAVIPSQWVDGDGDGTLDDVVFQVDLAPKQTVTFQIAAGRRIAPTRSDFKAFGRFARENHDDFAWENDRVAYRLFGPARETWAENPVISSGIDVWCKVKGALVINDWYLVGAIHRKRGQGGACYSLGTSRGVGGTALHVGDAFAPSRNFTQSRVYANGPIRVIFEVDYAPWSAGGTLVAETKRITLDAGAHFSLGESRFRLAGKGPLPAVGVGIARHPGASESHEEKLGVLRAWEPLPQNGKQPAGFLGTAVLVDPKPGGALKVTDHDAWWIVQGTDQPLRYAFGAAWNKGGDLKTEAAWKKYVADYRQRFLVPVELRLSAGGRAKR